MLGGVARQAVLVRSRASCAICDPRAMKWRPLGFHIAGEVHYVRDPKGSELNWVLNIDSGFRVKNLGGGYRSAQVAQQKGICFQCRRRTFSPWVGKTPWRRDWQSTPVFLPGESHGQRSLGGYSPWGLKESDANEHLSSSCRYLTLFSLPVPTLCPRVLLRPCNGPASSSLCPNAQPNLPCTPSQCTRGRA